MSSKTKLLQVRNVLQNTERFNQSELESLITKIRKWIKEAKPAHAERYAKRLTAIEEPLKQYYFTAQTARRDLLKLTAEIDREYKLVFIVHGRDIKMRSAVATYCTELGLHSVILEEGINKGQTVIEKFMREAEPCEFAIVLCSADDEGKLVGNTGLKLRPRQNVVLELGYFLHKLGRQKVFVLQSPKDMELPSDYGGMVYQVFDAGGKWKQRLRDELQAAKVLLRQVKASKVKLKATAVKPKATVAKNKPAARKPTAAKTTKPVKRKTSTR